MVQFYVQYFVYNSIDRWTWKWRFYIIYRMNWSSVVKSLCHPISHSNNVFYRSCDFPRIHLTSLRQRRATLAITNKWKSYKIAHKKCTNPWWSWKSNHLLEYLYLDTIKSCNGRRLLANHQIGIPFYPSSV